MKIQFAYKYTGENIEELFEILKNIYSILNEKDRHEIYVPVFDENKPETEDKILEHTLEKLNHMDLLFVLIRSEDKSEGMLLEAGYAFAKRKKIILAIQKDIKNSRIRDIADKIIDFQDFEDLYNKLKDLKIENNVKENQNQETKKVPKVWGSEEWIVNTDKYCFKKLYLNKGFRCSIHYHKNKDETFVIESGKVLMEVDDEKKLMVKGDKIRIKSGIKHRFSGIENSVIIEVSTHHEDDDSYRNTQSGEIPENEMQEILEKY